MYWDVVIVGGGCGGLATGALLSHSGYKVIVLERQARLGGRALTQEQKGFRLNLGLHTPPLADQGPLYRVLRTVGKLNRVRFSPPELDDSWSVEGNRLHRMILRPKHLLTSDILAPKSKIAFLNVAIKAHLANPNKLWDVSLRDWVESITGDIHVRRFLLDQAMVMMFDPNPGDLSTGQFLESFLSIAHSKIPFCHPRGGWSTIYDALAERVAEAGGQVSRSTKVLTVRTVAGHVQEVVLDNGESIRGRVYVVAIPPQGLPELLTKGTLPTDLDGRLRGLEPVSVATLDLGLSKALPVKTAALHSSDERIVVTSYCNPDTGLIPLGGQLIQALYFALPGELSSSEGTIGAHRRLTQFVEQYYPGAWDKAMVRRTAAFRSALSVRHKVGQARVNLPGPGLLDIENLFIAGDGTSAPGELSNIAWASAEAAHMAVQRFLAGTSGNRSQAAR